MCLITSVRGTPSTLDSLHADLGPALAGLGHHLAEYARQSASRENPEDAAAEFEWRLAVSAPAAEGENTQAASDRGEQLSKMLAEAVAHLKCRLGALLVPERHLRIVRTAGAAPLAGHEALRRLETALMIWVQRRLGHSLPISR